MEFGDTSCGAVDALGRVRGKSLGNKLGKTGDGGCLVNEVGRELAGTLG